MTFINAVKVTSPVEFKFTDHNRSSLGFNYEQIETATRTASGTMRKFIIATKRSFELSWEMLPSYQTFVVDGHPGAGQIKDFYESNVGKQLTLEIVHHESLNASLSSSSVPGAPAGTKESMNVFITSFSYDIIKRLQNFDYVNLRIGFTEV